MVTPDKRVCLLTGAGGRLGTAFCRRFAATYSIAAVYRRRPLMMPSQDQRYVDPLDRDAVIEENEHPVFGIRAELADDREIDRVVDIALARFGGVDLLVNAAGYFACGPLLTTDAAMRTLEMQFHVNAIVPLQLAVLLARRCWRERPDENVQRQANVVNVSSLKSARAYAAAGQSGYAASKAALNVLTAHMAAEFAPLGVRVNAVAPNRFPELVPTEVIVDAIRRFDQSEASGQIAGYDSPRLSGSVSADERDPEASSDGTTQPS
jgi:NAD(P)-dependent dehydrogenase (short-subunit alcohol dehydrogenase family)